MQDIYAQHQSAFNRVSAFVILNGSDRVATVAIKFPADGAGRLYAYVHWFGAAMVRGFANGYGYDKRSAAVASAIAKIACPGIGDSTYAARLAFDAFVSAFAQDGQDWTRALEQAGFTVLQAV